MKSFSITLVLLFFVGGISAQLSEVNGKVKIGITSCVGPTGDHSLTICGDDTASNFGIALRQGGEGKDKGIFFSSPGSKSSGRIFMSENVFSIGRGSANVGSMLNLTSNGYIGISEINPRAKLHVKDGDVYLSEIGNGVIMKSPNGQCWRYTPDDNGALVPTAIDCP